MEDSVLLKIKETVKKYNVKKVVLFGSRARRDNSPTSDYDIAIIGESLSAFDRAELASEIEEIDTLKKIDVVFIGSSTDEKLIKNISRDGVTIYE